MDIISFYVDLFKEQLINLWNYNAFKDIVIPLLNLFIVIWIYASTNKIRRKEIEENFSFQIHSSRPIFIFEPIIIRYEFDESPRNVLLQRWAYSDDPLMDYYSEKNYKEDITNKSFMRFVNIGDSYAKNIKITTHHINGKKYFDLVGEKTFSGGGRAYSISQQGYNKDKHTMRYSFDQIGEQGGFAHDFHLNNNATRIRKRIISKEEKIKVSIDKSDLMIINHSLYDVYGNITPYLKVVIEYQDKHNKDYVDEIFIGISRNSFKTGSSVREMVNATLSELDPGHIKDYENSDNMKFVN
ncbi:hypothetical protein ERX27_07515 [Macrococcus brunensis]|uniref:Uncharacterized protein n=1 Tax=Macrococcus brunensis TaxID=198483 RepID=A0A4R6BCZ1_9STAP|nr:hypothetical protein [Macrococcus brunensis]TDL96694.1 hypothetical protein ERX27_07515 [Macrococcus brunensis]